MANPLKAVMNIRRNELPLALLMFSYYFLVITSFYILKPIKKSVFNMFYDETGFNLFGWQMTAAQAEMIAKFLNMFVAYIAVVVFTLLARWLRRQQLTYVFAIFCMFIYVIYSLVIQRPTDATVWTFYLYGDLFNTLMVVTFFAFLNDSVTPEASKRLYGLIVLGGVAGGVFGVTSVKAWINSIPHSVWMWICFGLAFAIIIVAMAAGRIVAKKPPELEPTTPAQDEALQSKRNAALEGAKLVFRSRYLIAIVAIVGLYEIASQVMNFQFQTAVNHYLDGLAIQQRIADIMFITNWISMFVQLFLTSFIMSRFGLKTALMILPVAMMLGSAGFLVIPALWMGTLLWPMDMVFSYSLNQSAKEALYTPTSRDEKYKAKAFIDMFVQRFGKVVAIGVSLAVTSIFTYFSSVRWLSLFTVAVVFIWIIAVRYAGRRFNELTST